MKRRSFLNNAVLGVGALSLSATATQSKYIGTADVFHLHYAPHPGMFRHHAGEDLIDQIHFMADQGFTAMEDNSMKSRPIEMQEKAAKAMMDRGMMMGVFVAHKIYWTEPNLTSGKEDWRNEFLEDIRTSVEVAKRVNAKWMTVVPGHLDLRQDIGYQTQHVIESLKQACSILEPHGITMVLEPLNFRDHPGLFLTKSSQAYTICKSVDSPSCKILFDIYHQQIQEGNLIPNIEKCWDEIAYFQVGDNPDRNEPTTGEINYKNVFKYIHEKGYHGVVGMEHGNSQEGKPGESKVIEAYKAVDSF